MKNCFPRQCLQPAVEALHGQTEERLTHQLKSLKSFCATNQK